LAGSLAHGVSIGTEGSRRGLDQPVEVVAVVTAAHGASAPSARGLGPAGTISSGSTSSLVPSPVQSGQAPQGEFERERARLELVEGRPSTGTPVLRSYIRSRAVVLGRSMKSASMTRPTVRARSHRVGQLRRAVSLTASAGHITFDVVLSDFFSAGSCRQIVQPHDGAVHPGSRVTLVCSFPEQLAVLPLRPRITERAPGTGAFLELRAPGPRSAAESAAMAVRGRRSGSAACRSWRTAAAGSRTPR